MLCPDNDVSKFKSINVYIVYYIIGIAYFVIGIAFKDGIAYFVIGLAFKDEVILDVIDDNCSK